MGDATTPPRSVQDLEASNAKLTKDLEIAKTKAKEMKTLKTKLAEMEAIKAKMLEVEAKNIKLKEQEFLRQPTDQSNKSKSLASRINEAGSFSSIIKQLNFSEFSEDVGSLISEPQDPENPDNPENSEKGQGEA